MCPIFPLEIFITIAHYALESLWRTLGYIMEGWSSLWWGPPNFFGVGENSILVFGIGALDVEDVDYIVTLIMGWIEEQLLRIDVAVMQDYYGNIWVGFC